MKRLQTATFTQIIASVLHIPGDSTPLYNIWPSVSSFVQHSHHIHCSSKVKRSKVYSGMIIIHIRVIAYVEYYKSLMWSQPKRTGSDKIWRKIPKKHFARINLISKPLYNNATVSTS